MRSSLVYLLLAAWVGLGHPVVAQLPDSPTGRGGNTLIALFEVGSNQLTESYLRETFAEEILHQESAELWREWLAETLTRIGPLELHGVEKTGPFSATIVGRSSSVGLPVEIHYRVEETQPHRIAELVIDEGAGEPQKRLTRDQLESEARAYLDGLSEDKFSGVVLIARGDRVLFQHAKGLASRRYGVPNDVETRFNLGSINKLFTKVAIAQLAAAGKLDLDDRVVEHLPDYPNQEVAEKITIQQLVRHTAGLGDIFTEEFAESDKRQFRNARDYFRLFADQPLLFEPGTSQRYSNGGYMVLGAIIEAVTGQSYDEYVEQHIFAPAEMTSTASLAMDDPVPNTATGYTREGAPGHESGSHGQAPDPSAPWRENTSLIPFTGTPAGGGYSTARDLLHFSRALTGYELLDPRYTHWVVTDQLPDQAPETPDYGIGVAGGAPGVNAELEIGSSYTIVVLANLDPPSAGVVMRELRGLVEGLVE